MIKATDLMIGDWVQIVPDAPVMPNEYHRIDWIRTGEIGLDNRKIVTYPYIQPIPLTPEILEDNGWVKGDGYYCYRLCDAERLEYWLDDWRLERIWAGKGDKYLVTFRAFVSCVHTLQHALKLCGIDKEITL